MGEKCRARWGGDNQYYEAVIDSINNKENGEVTYTVTFLGYGTTEEVQEEALSSPLAGSDDGRGQKEKKDKDEAKKKRKVQLDEEGNIVIPKNLQINPNDSKEVRALKKKKIHAIRSTARFQKIDEETLTTQERLAELSKRERQREEDRLLHRKKAGVNL